MSDPRSTSGHGSGMNPGVPPGGRPGTGASGAGHTHTAHPTHSTAGNPAGSRGMQGYGTPAPARPAPPKVADDEPLALVDEEPGAQPIGKIHNISSMDGLSSQKEFKRPTHVTNTGAVRVRTFHCRLSENGVEHIDQAINDWLELHPTIEVKFATSVVGMWDGKIKEPSLIVNVWY